MIEPVIVTATAKPHLVDTQASVLRRQRAARMRRRSLRAAMLALAATCLVCGTASARTNPWFPLQPGSRWVYQGHDGGDRATDVVTVTHATKRIAGVRCRVVHDRVYHERRLVERTTDWYATDRRGTVRYYGEATAELDDRGHIVSTEGSWQAGRDGARAGVYMPTDPHRGERFFQERYVGVAEDRFRVLTRRASIRVPFATFHRDVLITAEWTRLEPGVRDRKWYARGIGQLAEATIRGGSERFELVSFHRGAQRRLP
jgi:hypothetical protein